ncbi:MAG: hypothetical protein ABI378_13230 [Chitinophagaceae bacterium]
MKSYFGNYKPGSWWVYLNRDSTKKDSVYIDNFEVKRVSNGDDCTAADETTFDLHSHYLNSGNILHTTFGYNGGDISTNIVEMIGQNNILVGYISAKSNVDTFYSGHGTLIYVYKLKNYLLWPRDSTYTFPEVTKWGRYVIAPDFGIILFNPINSTDTFSLSKFHIE